jgi:amidase
MQECEKDAEVVRRLRAAGAIFVGKTNTATFGLDVQCISELYGRTNNPWNLERTPGGSSGGPAAALASGMVPLELGD